MSDRHPDVLIVGGGLIGCACAYNLATRGLSVTLLERADLAAGASGACDGHVCCQSKTSLAHLSLARRSLELYESLSAELAEPTGYRRCGSWLVAETEQELRALRRSTTDMAARGLEVTLHTGSSLHEAEPALSPTLAGGAYCPTDGQTDPWRTTLAFASAAGRLGADIRLHTEAKALIIAHGQVLGAETGAGPLHAGQTLLTAGAWTTALCASLDWQIPLRPRRGEVLVSEPMPPMLSSIVLHAPYASAKTSPGSTRPATLVLEQITEGNLLIGSTRDYAGHGIHATPTAAPAIAREAARLAPEVSHLSIVRTFAGLRPSSSDGMPLIGPAPGVDRLTVATGHEGDGMALGPVTGQIVAHGIMRGDWEPAVHPSR